MIFGSGIIILPLNFIFFKNFIISSWKFQAKRSIVLKLFIFLETGSSILMCVPGVNKPLLRGFKSKTFLIDSLFWFKKFINVELLADAPYAAILLLTFNLFIILFNFILCSLQIWFNFFQFLIEFNFCEFSFSIVFLNLSVCKVFFFFKKYYIWTSTNWTFKIIKSKQTIFF